jgi:hypothetical protein
MSLFDLFKKKQAVDAEILGLRIQIILTHLAALSDKKRKVMELEAALDYELRQPYRDNDEINDLVDLLSRALKLDI